MVYGAEDISAYLRRDCSLGNSCCCKIVEWLAHWCPAVSAMQLLGLDYLVDTSLQPWLLEVNGTPSLAVDHAQPEVEALIKNQKVGCNVER